MRCRPSPDPRILLHVGLICQKERVSAFSNAHRPVERERGRIAIPRRYDLAGDIAITFFEDHRTQRV